MTSNPIAPRLRFEVSMIPEIARRYEYEPNDNDLLVLCPIIGKRGFLTKKELFDMAKWKAARSSGRIHRNSDEDVREITQFALRTTSERARIESLLILSGVGWPMASVILHFFHKEPYPILDFRALWSCTLKPPSYYNFSFWWRYVEFCRQISYNNLFDMRTLDKAMWQYSKENQS